MKKQNGITLVSLVITIIIMLILAGISLSMVMGENSVLEQAKTAVDETENSEEIERTEMTVLGSFGSNGKYDSDKAFEGIKKNYNLTGVTTTTNASGATVVTGVNSKTGENITLTHNTDGSIKVETKDYTLAFDGGGKVTEKNKLNGALAGGGNTPPEEDVIPVPPEEYDDLIQKEGCPLKFGRAYINPIDGGWMGLLPFADGSALVGWPGFGWASGEVQFFPAGSLIYENNNVIFDGFIIATCNDEGTEVYYDGSTFTLESILFGTNDCCSHNISRADAKYHVKTFLVGETESYTGDTYCVYCQTIAKEGVCKHIHVELKNAVDCSVEKDGYTGDTYCNDCEKIIKRGSDIKKTDFAITSTNRNMIGYTEDITELVIPEVFKGEDGIWYVVKKIETNAFMYCNNLNYVEIPDTVTEIKLQSFFGCRNLQKVKIGSGLTKIGDSAFNNCTRLSEVIYSSNSSLKSIGKTAFAGHTNNGSALQHVVIPDGVTSIGEEAFARQKSIKSITIPASVTGFGSEAFTLGYWNYKAALENVYYNGTLEQWCNLSFGYGSTPCWSGANLYIKGELVSSVIIPSNINVIKKYAFYGCKNITSVVIPENVTALQSESFARCTNLSNVVIPVSVKQIDYSTFSGCTNLNTINYNGTVAEWNNITFGNYWNSSVPATQVVCSDGTVPLK